MWGQLTNWDKNNKNGLSADLQYFESVRPNTAAAEIFLLRTDLLKTSFERQSNVLQSGSGGGYFGLRVKQ